MSVSDKGGSHTRWEDNKLRQPEDEQRIVCTSYHGTKASPHWVSAVPFDFSCKHAHTCHDHKLQHVCYGQGRIKTCCQPCPNSYIQMTKRKHTKQTSHVSITLLMVARSSVSSWDMGPVCVSCTQSSGPRCLFHSWAVNSKQRVAFLCSPVKWLSAIHHAW